MPVWIGTYAGVIEGWPWTDQSSDVLFFPQISAYLSSRFHPLPSILTARDQNDDIIRTFLIELTAIAPVQW